MTEVRLLTLNALIRDDVPARLRALGPVLERSGYDIVCLQEVLHRGSARLLRQVTPGYAHRAATGVTVLAGGLMLLSRWPIRRHRFARYPMTRPLRTELLMRKGAQLAVVETPAGPLAVVNTHLSANRDDDWSEGNRYTGIIRGELDRLARLVAGFEPALPAVVVGDFNVPRDSPVFTRFAAAAGLRDVLAGDTSTTFRPTPRWPAPPALDQVLIRAAADRPVTVRARTVLQDAVRVADGRELFLSDHYGIEANLSFGPPPGSAAQG
ncbi:endonuclease/exonuclease/phosphatase family protein [Dactylosporangium sp. NPDC049525]|uniref:endonuclease/exonuclease/phosphatase family protein n=1 Tax=Dactylosporangium sp. NPDC049525 TaxID=3154730 RepID=UPI003418D02E